MRGGMGARARLTLTLARNELLHGRISPVLAFWRDFFITGLLTLVCLLIGILGSCSRGRRIATPGCCWCCSPFPAACSSRAAWRRVSGCFCGSSGTRRSQLARAPALLLFGIYFPERSHIDAKAPWAKWVLLGVFGVSVVILYPSMYMEYYGGGDGRLLTRCQRRSKRCGEFSEPAVGGAFRGPYAGQAAVGLDQDARRRLRVLLTGMSVGVGSLLLVLCCCRISE